MKKSNFILTITAAAALTLTSCLTYPSATIVDGGPGWFSGDYAPYYWSDYNTPPPPPPPKPHHPGPGHKPGKPDGKPTPSKPYNPPGSQNPGTPQQGGFRGQK